MSFNGPALSIDDVGSILFDGEKFIVNVPADDELLEHFNPGERPVVYTHSSHAQNQQPSPDMPPSNNPILNKEKAIEHVERTRQERESARNAQSKPSDPVVPEDLPAETKPDIDMFDFLSLASGEEQAETDVWHENSRLTLGQAQHVDHLLAVETDSLAREALITVKREGLPPKNQWRDFMEQYALWSWDAESDARALATLATIAESDWDDLFALADADYVEAVAQDQANDWIEGLVVIHGKSEDILLNKTGVVRGDGSQYVGLQDYEVEVLEGLPLIFVHNHTLEVEASDEDLDSAFRAGAELLIVITPSGREQVFVRGRDRMVLVRDEKASYEVGSPTLEETIELAMKSAKEARAYLDDPPELIFQQEDPGLQINVEGMVQFAYSENAVVLNEGGSGSNVFEGSQWINVLGKSRLNPFAVLVEYAGGHQFWIDLKEYDATYQIHGAENLAGIPYADESAANTINPYTRTAMSVADLLPIAQEDITEMGVIAFGATGNDAWKNTGGFHPGFDIFAEAGTEVSAITSGEVVGIFVPEDVNYDHVYGSAVDSYDPYGEPPGRIYDPKPVSVRARQWFADNWLIERDHRAYVIVRSGNAYILYGHLDPNSIQVGTHVVAGQPIGAVGVDPHQDNAHLHFEVKTHGQTGIPLDENEEYVARSLDYRPQYFLNPLYAFTEDSRNRIITDYDLDPLDEQMLAIKGKEAFPHGYRDRYISYYWQSRTDILSPDGEN